MAADREAGFATVQHVLAAGLAMLFFALLANLIVMQYTLGAVTGALDEGVRRGARATDPVSACQERIDQALGAVLDGPLAGQVEVGCSIDGTWVRAQASGELAGWLPAVPDLDFVREAAAPLEAIP